MQQLVTGDGWPMHNLIVVVIVGVSDVHCWTQASSNDRQTCVAWRQSLLATFFMSLVHLVGGLPNCILSRITLPINPNIWPHSGIYTLVYSQFYEVCVNSRAQQPAPMVEYLLSLVAIIFRVQCQHNGRGPQPSLQRARR